MENLSKEEVFKKIYYNPSNPGSFGGIDALYREAKKQIPYLKVKDVKDWLSGELVYTLHKQARQRWKRNPMMAEKPREHMQADLIDMQEFAKDNDGYKFVLTAVDIFSKRGFAIPIKNKSQNAVVAAMGKILSQYTPFKLMTDEGTEFRNEAFKSLMNKYDIKHFFAKNKQVKCAVVERFNRTLKQKMFRARTLLGTNKYLDVLNKIVDAYNNSYHRSIKMTPNQVNDQNVGVVFKNLFGFKNKREFLLSQKKKPNLPIDGNVRKKYNLKVLERGYYPLWTDQVFEIDKASSGGVKPYYRLRDHRGNVDKKRYYPEEIQLVKKNLFRIEKVLKQRNYNGKKQFYVMWLNHPTSDSSWINAEDLTKING